MYHYTRDANNEVQIELIDGNGELILQQPVSVDDLLRQENHTLPVGNGVSLRLEEFRPEHHGNISEEEDASTTESDDEYDEEDADFSAAADGDDDVAHAYPPPPGTTQAGDWYEVLNAIRAEQQQPAAAGTAAAIRQQRSVSPGGRILNRAPRRSVATPLKKFTAQSGAAAAAVAADAPAKSRRDVWASFASPAPIECNYNRMEYVSVMGESQGRRFRPSALSFHAIASYLNASDRGQRVLVYGGVSSSRRAIEHELYEFSLLTGGWRRVEGKQFVPAGHMGHAMTVVESVDRLVVVGGIGPGGAPVDLSRFEEDPLRSARAKLLLPPCALSSQAATTHKSAPLGIGCSALSAATKAPVPIGFVSYLFDMDLSTHKWRAIQTAAAIPVIFHSAITFGREVFIFGGLTDELVVSGQLIAIDTTTYALRLIRPESGKGEGVDEPAPRYMHSAVRYGSYMVIHGGFDARNECRGDTWAFDLVNERWERLPCKSEEVPRAGHAASVVGCRMMLIGGFSASLEESAGEEGGGPASQVLELNLVPTIKGDYLWRDSIKTRPPLPPLAFSATTTCGDDCSLLVFGGLTKRPRNKRRDHDSTTHARKRSASASQKHGHHESPESEDQGFLSKLVTLDDSLVMTFPAKPKKAHHEDGEERHVNALGVEVDPDELPEHFKAFVRRQEDFLKKKNVSTEAAKRKITLEELEGMEPTIYLTEEEIEALMHKSEECCERFSSYKMDTLPGNVPDREERVHIVEECISLSRQLRDVVKSMKGSAPGITVKKTKNHRQRAGQKFEDYSAAKPFRRVVINNLVREINSQMATMHTLNKALRTVEWAEKDQFIEVVANMHKGVKSFLSTANRIVNGYIHQRVTKLMKGVEKHKEVMRLLTEVVEKNRHDKIWQVSEAPDKQRERVKGKWTKSEQDATKATAGKPPLVGKSKSRDASVKPHHRSASAAKKRALGAGFHSDESTASIEILHPTWLALQERAAQVKTNATALAEFCTQGMTIPAAVDTAPISASALLAVPPSAPLVSGILQSQTFLSAPMMPNVPQSLDSSMSSSGSPNTMPMPLQSTTAILPGSSTQPQLPAPPLPPQQQQQQAEAGGASPKMIVIRQSNARREKLAETARSINTAAESFLTLLSGGQETNGKTNAAASSSSSSSSSVHAPAEQPPATASSPLGIIVPSFSTGAPAATSQQEPATTTEHKEEQAAPEKAAAAATDEAPESHTLYLSSLRPLLEAREELESLSGKIALIYINEWDGNDLGSAPQDMKVSRTYSRLKGHLNALVQSITASFLTRAGAKKPRARPTVSESVKVQRPPTATRTRSAAKVAKKAPKEADKINKEADKANKETKKRSDKTSRSSSRSSNSSSRSSSSRSSSSRRYSSSFASGTASPVSSSQKPQKRAGVERPRTPPTSALSTMALAPEMYLHPLSTALLGAEPSSSSVAPATEAPATVVCPLVSLDVLRQGCFNEQEEKDSAATVVQLSGLSACDAKVIQHPIASAGGEQSLYYMQPRDKFPSQVSGPSMTVDAAGRWPGALPVTASPPPPAAAEPPMTASIALASASAVVNPPMIQGQQQQQHRRSTIASLTQANASEGGPDDNSHAAYLIEKPATSIAPGPFVVNAEHFYAYAPRGVEPPKQSAAAADIAHAGAALSQWADAEEDYFYFGRPAVPAGPARPPVCETERPSAKRAIASAPVFVSPTVGTALASQRVNAHVADGRAPQSAKTRRAPSSSCRTKTTASSTARAAAGGAASALREEARQKKMTPGELQIMQARERLRHR